MKVFNGIGSKERFLEMYQKVNKIKLNEDSNSDSYLMNYFNKLKTKNLKINQINNQIKNNENYLELICSDGNNKIKFQFKSTSSMGDQDGVYIVDDAKLISFSIVDSSGNILVSEDENSLLDFNNSFVDDIYNIVSDYADFPDESVENDEMFENAINLIDKIPYKKSTEDMQTKQSYLDQKPTNQELRVDSPELKKFAENEENDSFMLPPEYTDKEKMDILNGSNEDEVSVDDFEELTPEEEQQYLQAYENIIAKKGQSYSPTSLELSMEVDAIKNMANKQASINNDTHMATGKKRVYPAWADNLIENIVSNIDPKKVAGDFYEKSSPEFKNEIIKIAINKLNDILGNDKTKLSEKEFKEVVKALANELYRQHIGLMNEKDYPDPIGDKFKPKSDYPKKKKKQDKSVKIGESTIEDDNENEDDFVNFKPKNVGDGMSGDENNILAGGLGDNENIGQFDPKQILMGLEVEMEHTTNPKIALEIAMDHLTEIPDYYTHLNKMEREAGVDDAQNDAETDAVNPETEIENQLLGFESKNIGDQLEEDDYTGSIGDRYQDVDGNELTVSNKIDNGVTLKGENGEKEVPTDNLDLIKKINEYPEGKLVITEELVKIARQALSKRGSSCGMTKKEAVKILIKNNIK